MFSRPLLAGKIAHYAHKPQIVWHGVVAREMLIIKECRSTVDPRA